MSQAPTYVALVPVVPLIGAALNGLLGRRLGRATSGAIACAAVGYSFVLSLVAFSLVRSDPGPHVVEIASWMRSGSLSVDLALHVDPLSVTLMMLITGVGFLIHVYSTGYMHEDPGYARYFAYLNLFVFAMLVLVMGANLPLLFLGWEGVGLCSYLLIGFWFEDPAKAAAGRKAFIVNRIGDVGFALGMFWLFHQLHVLDFVGIQAALAEHDALTTSVATGIALLLFVGATGKSAQIPLYVWLPDAMAGPTPVSALIHAATMVTAGVYMICRLSALYLLAPTAMAVVATVGAATALFAGSIALAQNDIKKVLAYSTVSQLGYMFLAVGLGAFSAGIFHLTTHAFFKALLFLGAGSVIHALGGEQDVRRMGALWTRIPWTWGTFVVATFAIAGIPPLAGFFSKEEILAAALVHPAPGFPAGLAAALGLVGLVAAGITAVYMGRLLWVTFHGTSHLDPEVDAHVHESPASMTGPLVVLAFFSAIAGLWLGTGHRFEEFLAPALASAHAGAETGAAALAAESMAAESMAAESAHLIHRMLLGASLILSFGGVFLGYQLFVARPGDLAALGMRLGPRTIARVLARKYGIDELYDRTLVRPYWAISRALARFDAGFVDGLVNGAASAARELGHGFGRWSGGQIVVYATSIFVGTVGLLLWAVLG